MSEYNCLQELVLPNDFEYANKLNDCMADCLKRMIQAKGADDFARWEKEFNRCSAEFRKLREAKEEHDLRKKERCKFISGLKEKGVKAESVKHVPYITLERG